jgi:hypothetical protein
LRRRGVLLERKFRNAGRSEKIQTAPCGEECRQVGEQSGAEYWYYYKRYQETRYPKWKNQYNACIR